MLAIKEAGTCKYDLAALGSVNERAIPEHREPSEWTNRFVFEATGFPNSGWQAFGRLS